MHLKAGATRAILSPPSEPIFAQCLGELGGYLSACSMWNIIRNTYGSVLWADFAEPQFNKLDDLSEPELIRIHTQMPPEGHACWGASQASCQKCPTGYYENKKEPEVDHLKENVLIPSRSCSRLLLVLTSGIQHGTTYTTF